ncbi:MAG TPA: hypothetical protein VFG47_04180 [Geminicoccaceae bacterium]|nr:hypothetical protein [Geminicoccaceae bacterium]
MAGGQGAAGGGGPAPEDVGPPAETVGVVVIVHDLAQAAAALTAAAELGVAVRLRSAPGAAGYAGVGFLHALGRAVGHEPIVDCGDDPGLALGALRTGCRDVAFSGAAEPARRLADIAAQLGARLRHETGPPPRALAVAPGADAGRALRAWLVPRADA